MNSGSSSNGEGTSNPRKRPIAEANRTPTTTNCTIVAIDHTNFYYRVCAGCERPLPDPNPNTPSPLCTFCYSSNALNPPSSASKLLFRVLVSIATDTEVFVVILFDRAARVLFGCSADEFFEFAKTRPFAAECAGKALEGEMLRVTLSQPKNGNARDLRVVSVVPLRSGFQAIIKTLRELYQIRGGL
nr:Translation initiation factor IF-2 like [Ipomoea batatas]